MPGRSRRAPRAAPARPARRRSISACAATCVVDLGRSHRGGVDQVHRHLHLVDRPPGPAPAPPGPRSARAMRRASVQIGLGAATGCRPRAPVGRPPPSLRRSDGAPAVRSRARSATNAPRRTSGSDRSRAVEEARHAELARPPRPRSGRRPRSASASVASAEGHEGHDVDHPDPGVRPGVGAEVEDRATAAAVTARAAVLADQREHRPVVVGVGVHVEQRRRRRWRPSWRRRRRVGPLR